MERTGEAEIVRQNPAEEVIDFGAYLAVLRKTWWMAALVSVLAGIVTYLVVIRSPDLYTATAVVAPAAEENSQPRFLGALSSFGIDVGGASRIEDLEVLFRSDDLAVRVFSKYKVWPVLLADREGAGTGATRAGWLDRLLGRGGKTGPPTDWDAIRTTKQNMKIVFNKRARVLSIGFTSPSAEGSAEIVRYFLEEGKSRLQEEALGQTTRNRKFIEGQIARTLDPLVKERLYAIFSQEIEKEMMTSNRDHFGFRIIDSPRVPDRKSAPRRGRTILFVMTFSFLAFIAVAIARSQVKK